LEEKSLTKKSVLPLHTSMNVGYLDAWKFVVFFFAERSRDESVYGGEHSNATKSYLRFTLCFLEQIHLHRNHTIRHHHGKHRHTWNRFHQRFMSSFYVPDLKSSKRQWHHRCLFALLVTAHVKAVHKTLVKLTPGGIPIK